MASRLCALLLSLPLSVAAWAAPQVTPGPPLDTGFLTLDPGSLRIDALGNGAVVELPVTVTVQPVCVRAVLVGLSASGDGGAFANLTGNLLNGCGGDVSAFEIRLTGDGTARSFDIAIVDAEFGAPLASMAVQLVPDSEDTDGDGVADANDNCIEVANLDQRDTDADSIGNVCDPDVAEPNDCIVNAADLGVYKSQFFQTGDLATDNNGDGVTNALDLGSLRRFFFAAPGPSGLPNDCAALGEGEVCDPDASLCGTGLNCCYPCGVPGCDNICVVPCDPSEPACIGGCLAIP